MGRACFFCVMKECCPGLAGSHRQEGDCIPKDVERRTTLIALDRIGDYL